MTISPFRASGPCRRSHPAPGYPADGSQHSDTGSPPASPDSGFLVSTSDPSQPLRALPLAQRPRILTALPDAWCPRRGPLLTSRHRARPGPGEAPLGSRLRRVYADPEKPPRPREKRRESPRPAPGHRFGDVSGPPGQWVSRAGAQRAPLGIVMRPRAARSPIHKKRPWLRPRPLLSRPALSLTRRPLGAGGFGGAGARAWKSTGG